MNWIAINELSNKLPIPPGYRMEQLKRSEISEAIRCFKDWFPDVTVGARAVISGSTSTAAKCP